MRVATSSVVHPRAEAHSPEFRNSRASRMSLRGGAQLRTLVSRDSTRSKWLATMLSKRFPDASSAAGEYAAAMRWREGARSGEGAGIGTGGIKTGSFKLAIDAKTLLWLVWFGAGWCDAFVFAGDPAGNVHFVPLREAVFTGAAGEIRPGFVGAH